jgi:hypothetical protein
VRILNRSSRPTHEIRRILRRELARARPGSVYVFDRAHAEDPRQGHVRYDDRRVRFWLGRDREYPFSSTYAGPRGAVLEGAPEYVVTDWREELVANAAHEAYHLRAHDRGDVEDEISAERHALARVGRHRELEGTADTWAWWRRLGLRLVRGGEDPHAV